MGYCEGGDKITTKLISEKETNHVVCLEYKTNNDRGREDAVCIC